MGDVSGQTAIAVIGGAATLATLIWHAAMYVGKLTVKVDRHGDRLNDHDERLKDHDDELRFLKGIPR